MGATEISRSCSSPPFEGHAGRFSPRYVVRWCGGRSRCFTVPSGPPWGSDARQLHVLLEATGLERGRRTLPRGASPRVRFPQGPSLGRLQEVRAVEPDADRGAMGGGRDLRDPLPRHARPSLEREHRAREAVRGPRARPDRFGPTAGVRGLALRGSVRASEKEGDPRRRGGRGRDHRGVFGARAHDGRRGWGRNVVALALVLQEPHAREGQG